jgi:hypothetical protein
MNEFYGGMVIGMIVGGFLGAGLGILMLSMLVINRGEPHDGP